MLTLQIKEKEIENLTPEEEFVRGTVGAKCQINFDEFWQSYNKYIVFKRVGYEPINFMVDTLENEIEIPYTILAESGEFKIGVFGITETETLPTLYSKDIKILYGTDTHGTTPPTYIPSEIDQLRLLKQDSLVSGTNIKTINNQSILGSGNITIEGGSDVEVDQTFDPDSENAQSGKAVAEAVSTEQKRVDNTFSNALKGTISDTAMLLDDVSPVTHEMEVRVRSKNLFDKDMSFTDENYLPNQNYNSTYFIQLLPNTTYYVKTFNPLAPSNVGYTFINNRPNVASSVSTAVCVSGNYSTAENDWHIENYITTDNSGKLYIGNNRSLEKLKIAVQEANIQIELGTNATDYTPYVPDLTAVKVKKYGTNLIDGLLRSNSSIASGINIQYLPDEDCYLLNGTCTDTVEAYIISHNFLINDYITTTIITVSGSVALNGGYAVFCSGYKDSVDGATYNWSGPDISHSHSVTSSSPRLYLSTTKFYIEKGVVFEDYKIKIQVAKGKNAAEYEPFIASNEYTPTADGTVNGITSLYPNITLMTDTEGVIITCEYNRDINKAFAELQQAIISLGGNV